MNAFIARHECRFEMCWRLRAIERAVSGDDDKLAETENAQNERIVNVSTVDTTINHSREEEEKKKCETNNGIGINAVASFDLNARQCDGF